MSHIIQDVSFHADTLGKGNDILTNDAIQRMYA